MKASSKKGFTLVEIMIVVVIIGLLAAMAIPAFNKVREESRAKTVLNNLRILVGGAQQFILANNANTAAYADIVPTYVAAPVPVAGEVYNGIVIQEVDNNIVLAAPGVGASGNPAGSVTYSW